MDSMTSLAVVDLLIPLAIIILSAALIYLTRVPLASRTGQEGGVAPLEGRTTLLNQSEMALMARLGERFSGLVFFPCVSVESLFHVGQRTSVTDGTLDFLVCRQENLQPVCALFLARPLSDTEERRLRVLLEMAALPLLRISPEPQLALGELTDQRPDLFPAQAPSLQRSTPKPAPKEQASAPPSAQVANPPRTSSPPSVAEAVVTASRPAVPSSPAVESPPVEQRHASEEESHTCPTCGQPMARKRVRKGRHAGRVFWTCRDYPICKTLVETDKL
ncbi:MAG: topoisomerase DNA-binding C4 zinc finger domain-containing protein [Magnetococcales bacterium]|nr:topoisomerase DNA-binding C4 zinc finger domain-containing protein [Magnetococcales bacterium]